MRLTERYARILEWFQQNMPVAESELRYKDPYQLLVAVILSAQCTDKRVNMTTPALFERFPTPQRMAEATPEEIYPYIKSISYPNNKAKNLAGMARMLVSEFGGEVPSDLDQLQRLPGVGRKTAQRDRDRRFQRGRDAGGHARVPGVRPVGADHGGQNAVADRASADGTYSPRIAPDRAPLADPARALRMPGP